MIERVLSFVIGYLFGTILTADIVCRHYTGKPASEVGTRNPGMANIWKNVGAVPGVLVLLGDIAKAAVAIGISYLIFGGAVGRICTEYAGLGAVVGHNFPIWTRGKGGKGVTVTCVWMVLGLGIWGVAADIAGGIVVLLTGYLPLGAVVIGLASIPLGYLAMGPETCALCCIGCALMFSRHWHGLRRIARGEEHRSSIKLGGKKKAQEAVQTDQGQQPKS